MNTDTDTDTGGTGVSCVHCALSSQAAVSLLHQLASRHQHRGPLQQLVQRRRRRSCRRRPLHQRHLREVTRAEQKSSANTRSHQFLRHRVAEPAIDVDLSDCKFAGTRTRTSDAVHVDVCARTYVVPRGGDVCAVCVVRFIVCAGYPTYNSQTQTQGGRCYVVTCAKEKCCHMRATISMSGRVIWQQYSCAPRVTVSGSPLPSRPNHPRTTTQQCTELEGISSSRICL